MKVLVAQSSNTLRRYGLWSTRLLCPWNSPGKNFGVGCCALLQGISWTQVLNLGLLHCRQISFQTLLLSLGKAKVTGFRLCALSGSFVVVSLNSCTLIYSPFRVIICILCEGRFRINLVAHDCPIVPASFVIKIIFSH